MEYLLLYLCMVTVPHIMVRLERMLDYRGVGLARFYCIHFVVLRSKVIKSVCLQIQNVFNK